jgi:hypothetical protein
LALLKTGIAGFAGFGWYMNGSVVAYSDEEAGEYVLTEVEVTVFFSFPFRPMLQLGAATTNPCRLVLHAQIVVDYHSSCVEH